MAKQKKIIPAEYQDDVLELFRKVVGGVRMSDVKHYDALRGQERIDFLKYCRGVYGDKFFKEIIQNLIFECVIKAAMQSRTMDEVLVNRATANGIKLVEDFFLKYNNIHIAEIETQTESFDSNAPFEAMTE